MKSIGYYVEQWQKEWQKEWQMKNCTNTAAYLMAHLINRKLLEGLPDVRIRDIQEAIELALHRVAQDQAEKEATTP